MRYTQSQVRQLLSIPVETLRVWRDAVPALARYKGHAPSFTPGDVVALAVLASLVRDVGVRVGVVGARLDELFTFCHGQSWLSLERCVVLIDSSAARLVASDDPRQLALNAATLVVPCAPVVARLQAALARAEVDEPQGHLQLQPTAVGGGAPR